MYVDSPSEEHAAPEDSAVEESASPAEGVEDASPADGVEGTSPEECTVVVPGEGDEKPTEAELTEVDHDGSDYHAFLAKERPPPDSQRSCCWKTGGCLGTFGFAVIWILCLIPVLLVLAFGLLPLLCTCGNARKCCFSALNKMMVAVFTAITRFALFLCCWIRIDARGFGDLGQRIGKSGRPALIISNHASFLDILLIITLLPFATVLNVKMLVSFKLFKIPVLGGLIYAMGHLSVRNTRKTDNVLRKTQTSKSNAHVAEEFVEHLEAGGCGGWFPEGLVNFGNTHQVQLFKKGGFAPAINVDVELWCVSFVGNAVAWHGKGAPGKPARIGASITCLCDSTHAFLAQAGLSLENDKDACLLSLAGHSQALVQKGVDDLVAEGFIGN